MKLQTIYDYLNELSPFELQESWDNSGLIVGHPEREVEKIVVSLDLDESMIEEAEEGVLFVVHHPLIFGKLTELDFRRYPANLIERLIRKRQSLIAMHTNFDRTHLNRYVFSHVLGLEPEREEPFLCEASVDWSLEELQARVKEAFGLERLRVVAPRERIGSVALCTGAGASMMDRVEAECFLTGDIKYHDAMKAMSQGLMMVDIGHFESERFFPEALMPQLKNLPISAIIAPSKNPFTSL
ncbi:Nif3-like dinuclear metal center hexameric protein [Nitratifractor sp.]